MAFYLEVCSYLLEASAPNCLIALCKTMLIEFLDDVFKLWTPSDTDKYRWSNRWPTEIASRYCAIIGGDIKIL